MKKVVAIYHKNCVDGTASAAVVLKKYPDAKLFPLSHSFEVEELDEVLQEIDEETMVYTVDCVIGVTEILEKGYKVTAVDHHASDVETYKDLDTTHESFSYIFDNEKSGATLTWSTLFPEVEAPKLLTYIEDIDLWRLKYGQDSIDVNNYLSLLRNDPAAMLALFDEDLSILKERGASISKFIDMEIAVFTKQEPLKLKVGNETVLAFNITTHQSPAGNKLSSEYGQVVALYAITGERVKISLRSVEGQSPSALDIAKALGGGGHECSSGAGIALEHFLQLIDR